MSDKSLKDWQEGVHETNRSKGWWDGFAFVPVKPLPDGPMKLDQSTNNYIASKLCLVHSEVSEALEALRDGRIPLYIDPETGKPEGLESELADVIIRVLDLAEALGLDMGEAMLIKADYNKTRVHRHGGRQL
jgi:NTP pyrophosphatase (non-canonical NTP hydrolase)